MTKTVKKYICLFFFLLLCIAPLLSHTAFAALQYRLDERGNWFYRGGMNSFKGKAVEKAEDMHNLEYELIANDYFQLKRPDHNEYIDSGYFDFYMYLEDEYVEKDYKVFVYKPSYDDFMENYMNNKYPEYHTLMELQESTVILNYQYWESIALIGTEIDINEELDEKHAAYIELRSPVDCEVVMECLNTHQHYTFHITGGVPAPFRVRQSQYIITSINSQELDSYKDGGEATLPTNNYIPTVREDPTNPYVIDLTATVEKYDIKPIDFTKPASDNSTSLQFLTTESTVLMEKDKQGALNELWVWAIILGIFGIAAIVFGIIMKKKNKDNKW